MAAESSSTIDQQPESSESKGNKKRDVRNATLDCKKAVNRLVVNEAIFDESSVVCMNLQTMNILQFEDANFILIKRKKRKNTICIVVPEEKCNESMIMMDKVVRSNLGVELGDVVSVYQCPDIKNAKRIWVLPIDDTVEGITRDLVNVYLEPYFERPCRPVRNGNLFHVVSEIMRHQFFEHTLQQSRGFEV